MFSFHEFWLPWGIEQDIFSYGKWEGIFKACAAVQGSEIGSNVSCSGWFLFGSLLNVCRWIQQQPFYLVLRGKADDSWLFSHFDFVIWKKKRKKNLVRSLLLYPRQKKFSELSKNSRHLYSFQITVFSLHPLNQKQWVCSPVTPGWWWMPPRLAHPMEYQCCLEKVK